MNSEHSRRGEIGKRSHAVGMNLINYSVLSPMRQGKSPEFSHFLRSAFQPLCRFPLTHYDAPTHLRGLS